MERQRERQQKVQEEIKNSKKRSVRYWQNHERFNWGFATGQIKFLGIAVQGSYFWEQLLKIGSSVIVLTR